MGNEGNQNMLIYEMQANICHALSHPVRLYILDLLSSNEMSSSELLEVLEIPKANLSQHLAVLKEAGILKSRKEGAFQVLSLAIPMIKDACQLVRGILLERLSEEQRTMSELKKNLDLQVKNNVKKMPKKKSKKMQLGK